MRQQQQQQRAHPQFRRIYVHELDVATTMAAANQREQSVIDRKQQIKVINVMVQKKNPIKNKKSETNDLKVKKKN